MTDGSSELVGANIRRARAANRMTQRRLADVVECHHTYISHLEHGRKNPSLSLLREIADALWVRPSSLLAEPTEDMGRDTR